MRAHRIVLTATIVAIAPVARAQQSSPIDRVAWMAGCWELRTPTRAVMEMWMPPMGGVMLGASRTVVGGVMREFEQLRITTRGDTLVYTALPSGQKETDFKTTTASVVPGTIAFENRAHDFPQAIMYRRVGADSLVARVEGPGPNGTTRGVDFAMRRASCTTPAGTQP